MNKTKNTEIPKGPQNITEAKQLIKDWGLPLNLTKTRLLKPPSEKCSCHKHTCKTCFEYKLLNHVYKMSQKKPNWIVTLTVSNEGGKFKDMEHARKEFQRYKKKFLRRIERRDEKFMCSPDTVFEKGKKSGKNYHIHMITNCDYFAHMNQHGVPNDNRDPDKHRGSVLRKDWKKVTGCNKRKECRVHIRIYRDVYWLTYSLKNYDGTRKYLWLSKKPDIGSCNIDFDVRRRSNPKLKDNRDLLEAIRIGDKDKVLEMRRRLHTQLDKEPEPEKTIRLQLRNLKPKPSGR